MTSGTLFEVGSVGGRVLIYLEIRILLMFIACVTKLWSDCGFGWLSVMCDVKGFCMSMEFRV